MTSHTGKVRQALDIFAETEIFVFEIEHLASYLPHTQTVSLDTPEQLLH